MKSQTKRIVSLIASACLVATSLSAFGVSAEEESDVVVTEAPVVTSEAVKSTTAATATAKSTTTQSTTVKSTTTQSTTEDDSEVKDTTISTKAIVNVKEDEGDTTDATTTASNSGETTVASDSGENTTVTTVTTSNDGDTTATGSAATTVSTDYSSMDTDTTAATTTKATTTTIKANTTGDGTISTITTTINGNVVTTVYDDATTAAEDVVEYTHTNDVILTIDTSSSMVGEPLDLVKDTAIQLVDKILAEDPDAQISLVELVGDNYSYYFQDEDGEYTRLYSNDRDELVGLINDIYDSVYEYDLEGDTDYLLALEQIKLVLDDGTGEDKSVVIMTDGVSGINDAEVDEDGDVSIFYDVPDKYVIGEDLADEYQEMVLDYANEVIKPIATIYTVGYFQNLTDGEEAGEARDFLMDLASDGTEGVKYYEADEKNIDEITDLITQDIVYHAPPEGKEPEDNTEETSNEDEDKDANSPKTGDAGVASVILLGGLACALVVTTKKKHN